MLHLGLLLSGNDPSPEAFAAACQGVHWQETDGQQSQDTAHTLWCVMQISQAAVLAPIPNASPESLSPLLLLAVSLKMELSGKI